MTTRTTHRSSTGTKLYAVRDAKGRFTARAKSCARATVSRAPIR